jgi:1-acyl-sn-glycerol-3-phosphate acyltransferase
MRNLSRALTIILNIKIEKIGTPPKAPFFMVSNHLSYVDILVMFINMNCTFVAKKEVRSWPVLGFMIMTMGVIFIDRSRKRDVNRVNETMRESLNPFQGIVIYPEGTTTGGDRVLPFRSPLLEMPASEGMPVWYSAIQYKTHPYDPPAEETVCFYGARDPFHKHLFKLACNRRIEATVIYGKEKVTAGDRKELAQRLHSKVEQASTRLRKEMKLPVSPEVIA